MLIAGIASATWGSTLERTVPLVLGAVLYAAASYLLARARPPAWT